MFKLTLDTSTENLLLAVSSGKEILQAKALPHHQNLSKTLVPMIDQLFQELSLDMGILSSIYVGVGPGSYTGTRVGVATASALALALSIPLHPFCSLLAFLPKHIPDGPFAFVCEAKHTPHFVLSGAIQGGAISSDLTHTFIKDEELSLFLQNINTKISFSATLKPFPDSSWFPAEPNIPLLQNYLLESILPSSLSPKIFYFHHF